MGLRAEMRDVLLTAVQASLGAVTVILIVIVFLSSVTLRNRNLGFLEVYFNQHTPQFRKVKDVSVLDCVRELNQN